MAETKGISNATLAYAWLMHQSGVSAPIVGASKTWQLDQAVAAIDVQLSKAEIEELGAGYEAHSVQGHV